MACDTVVAAVVVVIVVVVAVVVAVFAYWPVVYLGIELARC